MKYAINFPSKATCLAIALSGIFSFANASDTDGHVSDAAEKLLLDSLHAISINNVDNAIASLRVLISQNPNFKLAQMVYADLLMAKTKPLLTAGEMLQREKTRVEPLLQEARIRWRHQVDQPQREKLPKYIVQLNNEQRHFIVVDLSYSRLYLYENSGEELPRLIDDYYVSMGKNGPGKILEGDKRTPIGVYFIRNYLSPDTLPEFYGNGAFPINYPNSWDRLLRRTGDGIWLHGNPLGTFSRPPRDSDGCVTVANHDFDRIKPFIEVGKTPFIIANGVEWVDQNELREQRESAESLVENWREDWESLDNDKYLQHYSKDFSADNKNYRQWAEYKKLVNANKDFVKVQLDKVSILRYPGSENVIVVDFEQTYESNNYRGTSTKRQYWKIDDDGQWRIFYEGSA